MVVAFFRPQKSLPGTVGHETGRASLESSGKIERMRAQRFWTPPGSLLGGLSQGG